MRRTFMILGGLLIALGGCSKANDAPIPKQDNAYRPPTANEVFDLRSKCAKLGDVLSDEDVVGPALNKGVASHYNPKTNRCYIELTVMKTDNPDEYYSDYLYDGQTKEILISYTKRSGKLSFINIAQLPNGDPQDANVTGEEDVLYAIRFAMADGRKN